MFAGINEGREAQAIESLMQGLRQKVLNGETLNNFKKEIAQISVLIEKCENQQLFEKSVYYLAQILQKPEKEISLMLKRNSLQDKKKKKKNDIDKKRQTISQLIERELKESNTQVGQIISLEQLEPGKFHLNPSQDLINLYQDLKKNIEEFVLINNEYIQIKLQEEKAKNKKQKTT